MQTKEAIQFALTVSEKAVLGVIDEMHDSPLTFPTANGGCHPLWVLGHLTLIEGMIPQVLYGESNPAAAWAPLFGQNSTALDDENVYPSFAEVRRRYDALRKRNIEILNSLSAADLDKPTTAPLRGREEEFATYGRSFLALALHQMLHRAHVTDARRSRRASSAVNAR